MFVKFDKVNFALYWPLVPAEKLSTNRTVLCSNGTVVPPDWNRKLISMIISKLKWSNLWNKNRSNTMISYNLITLTVIRTIGWSWWDSQKLATAVLTPSRLDGLVSSARNRSISLQISSRFLFSSISVVWEDALRLCTEVDKGCVFKGNLKTKKDFYI